MCVPCAVCRAPPCRANQRGGNCFGSEAVHPLPCPPCARSRRGTYGLGHLRRRSRRAPSRAPRGWGLGGQARPRQGGQKILLGSRTRTGKGRAVGKSQRSNGGVPFRPGRSQRPHARPPARASYSKQQQQAWMRGAAAVADGRCCLGRSDRGGIHCGSRGCRAAVPSRGSAAARAYCCWY